MSYPTKIATCCHCGTKAALTLDAGRHALSCASCGAPLRDLKMIPKQKSAAKSAGKSKQKAVSHRPELRRFAEPSKASAFKNKKPRKVKKRKGWLKNIAEEMFDFVEDVFD